MWGVEFDFLQYYSDALETPNAHNDNKMKKKNVPYAWIRPRRQTPLHIRQKIYERYIYEHHAIYTNRKKTKMDDLTD